MIGRNDDNGLTRTSQSGSGQALILGGVMGTRIGPAAMVIGGEFAFAQLSVTWPGDGSFGTWEFEVDGFEAAFFNCQTCDVEVLRWDHPSLVGKAQAVAATREREDGPWRTRFVGHGPLDEVAEEAA